MSGLALQVSLRERAIATSGLPSFPRLTSTYELEHWEGKSCQLAQRFWTHCGIADAVMTFFQGLSPGLGAPGNGELCSRGAPWRARDHFAHLVKSERNIQNCWRRALAGGRRDVLLRLQYPEGMPMPGVLGDLSALTRRRGALVMAIAKPNQLCGRAPQRQYGDAGSGLPGGPAGNIAPFCTSHR